MVNALSLEDLWLSILLQTEQNKLIALFAKLMGNIVDSKHIATILRDGEAWGKDADFLGFFGILV